MEYVSYIEQEKEVLKEYRTSNHLIHTIKSKNSILGAMIDYAFGFSTSYDGDNKEIININNHCSCCGEYFEEYREEGVSMLYCKKCRKEIE